MTEIKDTVPGFVNNGRTLADAPDSIGDAAARREAGMTSDAAPGKAQARWRSVLDIVAVVLAIVASVVLIVVGLRAWFSPMAPPAAKLSAHRDPPLPTEPLSLEGAALKGSKTAKVAMVEYSEFQCPYSGKFAREILPGLEQKYVAAGKVLLAFRNFPLDSHPFAKRAAAAGVCANQQAKFWQAHDLFFRADSTLDEATIEKAMAQLGLDGSRFSACLAREATSQVSDDIARGRALQVSGTPTFFIGTIQSGAGGVHQRPGLVSERELPERIRSNVRGVLQGSPGRVHQLLQLSSHHLQRRVLSGGLSLHARVLLPIGWQSMVAGPARASITLDPRVVV